MGVMDYPANEVIASAAAELKKNEELKAPDWVGLVKAGSGNERVPAEADFWFKRMASILFTIYKRGPVGTERLRNKYGEKRGHQVSRSHHVKAGGKTIRLCLQKLEKIGFIALDKAKKGRMITPKGIEFLDECVVKK